VKHDLTANYFKTKRSGLVILAEAWTSQETTAKSDVPLVQLLSVQEFLQFQVYLLDLTQYSNLIWFFR
jgi:hypothetical protein